MYLDQYYKENFATGWNLLPEDSQIDFFFTIPTSKMFVNQSSTFFIDVPLPFIGISSIWVE